MSICIISCSKNANSPQSPTQVVDSASISYKFNDTLVTVEGGYNSYETNRQGVYVHKRFLGFQNANWVYDIIEKSGFYNSLLLSIYTDSLKVQNYNYKLSQPYTMTYPYQGLFLGITYNKSGCQIFLPNDSVSLNITKYSNGYISGTFAADLTPAVGNPVPGSTKITSGSFQNLQVIY